MTEFKDSDREIHQFRMRLTVLIALVCLPLWALTSTIDAVKVLVLLAYLAAHQSGYLIGAFIGARGHDDR